MGRFVFEGKHMSVKPALTLDIDWAPDFVIDFCANLLVKAEVRATWFVTHDSPAVQRLRSHPKLFEIGIHPNFLPGTTHGDSESEILAHCMGLAPEAKVVRTHGLFQTSNLLERIIDETPVQVDVSLFLPHAQGLAPVEYHWEGGKRLIRLPYVWEDDFEMVRPDSNWDLGAMIDRGNGLMIFDFHPIHVYLNSLDLGPYRALRALGRIADLSKNQVDAAVRSGLGARYALQSAIERMQGENIHSLQEISIKERD